MKRIHLAPQQEQLAPVPSSSSSSSLWKEINGRQTTTTELTTTANVIAELINLGLNPGLARRAAQDNDPADLRLRMDWYIFALENGQALGAGYLAASIRERWGPPAGYYEAQKPKPKRRWYTDEEYERFFVHGSWDTHEEEATDEVSDMPSPAAEESDPGPLLQQRLPSKSAAGQTENRNAHPSPLKRRRNRNARPSRNAAPPPNALRMEKEKEK